MELNTLITHTGVQTQIASNLFTTIILQLFRNFTFRIIQITKDQCARWASLDTGRLNLTVQYFSALIFRLIVSVLNPLDTEGLGLGMTLVRKIVERHKGKIRVESELNKGTAFYITIPKR